MKKYKTQTAFFQAIEEIKEDMAIFFPGTSEPERVQYNRNIRNYIDSIWNSFGVQRFLEEIYRQEIKATQDDVEFYATACNNYLKSELWSNHIKQRNYEFDITNYDHFRKLIEELESTILGMVNHYLNVGAGEERKGELLLQEIQKNINYWQIKYDFLISYIISILKRKSTLSLQRYTEGLDNNIWNLYQNWSRYLIRDIEEIIIQYNEEWDSIISRTGNYYSNSNIDSLLLNTNETGDSGIPGYCKQVLLHSLDQNDDTSGVRQIEELLDSFIARLKESANNEDEKALVKSILDEIAKVNEFNSDDENPSVEPYNMELRQEVLSKRKPITPIRSSKKVGNILKIENLYCSKNAEKWERLILETIETFEKKEQLSLVTYLGLLPLWLKKHPYSKQDNDKQ